MVNSCGPLSVEAVITVILHLDLRAWSDTHRDSEPFSPELAVREGDDRRGSAGRMGAEVGVVRTGPHRPASSQALSRNHADSGQL